MNGGCGKRTCVALGATCRSCSRWYGLRLVFSTPCHPPIIDRTGKPNHSFLSLQGHDIGHIWSDVGSIVHHFGATLLILYMHSPPALSMCDASKHKYCPVICHKGSDQSCHSISMISPGITHLKLVVSPISMLVIAESTLLCHQLFTYRFVHFVSLAKFV